MIKLETTELTEQQIKELEEEYAFLKERLKEIEEKLGY